MRVLKFYADWCGPCKMLDNVIQEAKIDIPIEKINVDKEPEMAMKYRVRGIPTMVILNDENEVIRTRSGLMKQEELKQFIGE